MGAAIHAASLVNDEGDAFLLDVTPLSLQIGVAGGLTEPIIERNTPVPIEQTRAFTTFHDHQESVTIRIFQGESREASENELLGQFEFSGFQTGKRGEVEIEVTFEIDTDGIVNVTARDRGTGEEASTRITLSSGLSENEMSDILERGVADRVETVEAEPLAAPAGEPVEPVGDDELVPLSDEERELETGTAPPSSIPPVVAAAVAAPASAPDPQGAPEPDLDGIITAVDLGDPDVLETESVGTAATENQVFSREVPTEALTREARPVEADSEIELLEVEENLEVDLGDDELIAEAELDTGESELTEPDEVRVPRAETASLFDTSGNELSDPDDEA